MKIKKILKMVILFIAAYLLLYNVFIKLIPNPNFLSLSVSIQSDSNNEFQVYYSNSAGEFSEDQSIKKSFESAPVPKALKFNINTEMNALRLDLGNHPSRITLQSISLGSIIGDYSLPLSDLSNSYNNEIDKLKMVNNNLEVITNGGDPYILLPISDQMKTNIINDNLQTKTYSAIFLSMIASIFICVLILIRGKLFRIFKEFNVHRALILNLSKNDFKTKYAGSYLGVIWGYVQPITTILVYWFVFQVGLKVTPTDNNVPFAVWFMAGLIPWFFFSDALSNASNSFVEYSFLVKKLVFKVSILPIVKIISSLFVHLVFIVFLYIVYFSYGFNFHAYNIQLLYYSLCTLFFTTALSYLTSSVVVFFKDLGQIIVIFLQVGMWITPIMWSEKILSDKYSWLFKMNPMYYVVEGYRDSLFNRVWFTEHIYLTFYFWSVTFFFLY